MSRCLLPKYASGQLHGTVQDATVPSVASYSTCKHCTSNGQKCLQRLRYKVKFRDSVHKEPQK